MHNEISMDKGQINATNTWNFWDPEHPAPPKSLIIKLWCLMMGLINSLAYLRCISQKRIVDVILVISRNLFTFSVKKWIHLFGVKMLFVLLILVNKSSHYIRAYIVSSIFSLKLGLFRFRLLYKDGNGFFCRRFSGKKTSARWQKYPRHLLTI